MLAWLKISSRNYFNKKTQTDERTIQKQTDEQVNANNPFIADKMKNGGKIVSVGCAE